MASVEVLGLLCSGSTMFHDSIGGGGTGDRLTRAELAGYLAGLGDVAMNLAMAKYCGDADSERMLVAQIRVWVANLAGRESWQVVKGRPTILNLSALATFEVVRPNRCGRCRGTGFKATRVCPACSGTGFKALSGRQIAEAIFVDECNYRRLWKSRYEAVYSHVAGLDSEISRSLRLADRRDDLAHC